MTELSVNLESDEFCVDNLTGYGSFPLSFTGLLFETTCAEPSIVSARLLNGNRLVLAHTLCERELMLDRLLSFLRQRGVYWLSSHDLWRWAVYHRWPHAHDLHPASSTQRLEEYSELCPPLHYVNEQYLRTVITQHGRYAYNCCFSLDQLIVAWEPIAGKFSFPNIYDFAVLQHCIRLLETQGAAFSIRGYWIAATPQRPSHTFADLIRFAELRYWPEFPALLQRVAFWEAIRHSTGG